MKFTYILIAFIIAAGLVYALSNQADTPLADEMPDTTTPVAQTANTETTDETSPMDNDINEDDATPSNTDTVVNEAADTKEFAVAGVNFAYDVEEIRVQEGDTVTINFESVEGFHDWVVDEFDAATAKVRPGEGVTSVTFIADTAGTYEYYCSVGSHRANGMVGTLIVE